MSYFYKYLTIFISALTVNIFHTLYLYLLNIDRDLSYFTWLIFSTVFSLFESLYILLIYFIFFNSIYRIELKNINLYFLILFISSIFWILWEISYTTSWLIDFIFNYDIIANILFYIIWIWGYWYYLKYIKKN